MKISDDWTQQTKASVTNFLYCGDEYLFIKRNPDSRVMPSQVNGIGGKLKNGESYVSAAIRETDEETGYQVNEKDIKFCGLIKFENREGDDWITCFFKIAVADKKIPTGNKNEEGELFWVNKNEVLSTENIADDINYIWEDVVDEKNTFFLTVEVNDNQFKIVRADEKRLVLKG